MPHYDELYPGRFLKGTTLEGPTVIRILSMGGEVLEGEKGNENKGILRYRTAGRDGRPVEGEIVWCKTNAILTSHILGSDYAAWAGRCITIHYDPTVKLGREQVGGIRVFGSPELKEPKTVEIKRPRRKAERWRLVPTDGKGREKGATTSAPGAAGPAEATVIADGEMTEDEKAAALEMERAESEGRR